MGKILDYAQPSLQGTLRIPGDKSVSHRSIMFGAIGEGTTTVEGFLQSDDCLATIDCFSKLGVEISVDGESVQIKSDGIGAWQEPREILYTGNSGTTTRLMLGILAGSNVSSVLIGDESIQKRPMKRVTAPLKQMGAHFIGREDAQFTPIAVEGTKLNAIHYQMPVASAQVKSAILLAALHAEGETVVEEMETSRDHTEKMLQHFGAEISVDNKTIRLKGGQKLHGTHVVVPGDISSAAFFLVAGAIVPNSKLTLTNVGLNKTRTGIIDVLQAMGAKMSINDSDNNSHEEMGTIGIESSSLKGTEIGGDLIPRLIDEIPVIALLATQAEGKTIIKNAEELKVKETNRIDAVVNELKKLGANITATDDGMIIEGPTPLHGGDLTSYGDHRIGMMAAIASLITSSPVTLDDTACIAVSYPTFFEQLDSVRNS
ncbi:3-phosphoshikimate 1-carboxyvinyltransferase [Psychrobacillus lasiicapitis]|uniref:3-phosphoshikimate 1-carboxyvinyltransferase n=1 Tax=Psychrobacillus lasiicapitis TaxID=1636719 RepID=A0A544THN9_9BACI|nr:3-phosphoshikimate 1-carboxyvinyltransferase [Psychrobacillus lasiicapitis]TQR16964.1 3-phosphoshikimate 1-carboxyvinyltransferase [Psychrobacillus lasiicapitis]GGA25695.1 3-phosphoshikimate 1-carboxyvinyltransferase [Psychrobacillus lasiicapitis]